MLKKGRIEFTQTGDVWEGELVDFQIRKWYNSTFIWVGTMKKKGEEKGESGVWKCEDSRETYKVLDFICDLETWEKGLEKKKSVEVARKKGEELVKID